MKRLVSLALSATLALSLLAGCGNSVDPQTTGTAPSGGNKGTGEAKDTIVWAQSSDINSLDFHVGKQYLSYGVTCNIFDTLVSWDADNNVIPMLATEWEFLDEDSIQFKLREGVTFHDGEPFTAEDVKYTYERARDHTIVKNNFSWLESVDVVDDYTVVINTIGAYSPVLNALCSPLCGIMPKHLMEANENAMAEFPIGTGPYKFVERAEGEYIKMEANEDYWGGAPKTKYLEMRVVPEASQRSVLLETGEIDFAYAAPRQALCVQQYASGQRQRLCGGHRGISKRGQCAGAQRRDFDPCKSLCGAPVSGFPGGAEEPGPAAGGTPQKAGRTDRRALYHGVHEGPRVLP